MRFLKLYGGILLTLISVLVLVLTFYKVIDLDKEVYNGVLVGCAVAIVLGVIVSVVGGKSADKIGGK